MRITNKIMQNNSIYNINNNKTTEDTINTQVATGKKLTRPSDDPVIAIRALRLRSTVTELTQYYSKNASDAESWLSITEDALSTVTDVITSMIQQANKGVNQYQDLDDVNTILTEMNALSKEYYSTGNEDYAGRYIFTGYRTDTPLTFSDDDSSQYKYINDESNASNVDTSSRITGVHNIAASDTTYPAQSSIAETTVGRVRLSYNNADSDVADVSLRYRTPMVVSATTTLSTLNGANTADIEDTLALTYKDGNGITHKANVSTITANTVTVTESDGSTSVYSAVRNVGTNNVVTYTVNIDNTAKSGTTNYAGSITLNASGVMTASSMTTGSVTDLSANVGSTELSTVRFTPTSTSGELTIQVPLTGASENPYTVALTDGSGNAYTMTVNTDGTYMVSNEVVGTSTSANVINLSSNGSFYSSYNETILYPSSYTNASAATIKAIDATTSDADIDAIYQELAANTTTETFYLNAKTGEMLLSAKLKDTLSSLSSLTNANTIDAVYDKSSWLDGDIRPENLMKCTNVDNDVTIVYNGGNAGHIMEYDIGYGQTIDVNTTADEVFTTSVKRDVEDLENVVNQMQNLKSILSTMTDSLNSATNATTKADIQTEIDATQKAYDYLKDNLKTMFGKKITSMQGALSQANVAVTENGTRSSRLSMTQTRLQNQLTTFKTLQSNNEDIDLAETSTNLATAELTYQASLMATSKIMKESLMDYI